MYSIDNNVRAATNIESNSLATNMCQRIDQIGSSIQNINKLTLNAATSPVEMLAISEYLDKYSTSVNMMSKVVSGVTKCINDLVTHTQ